MVPTKMLQMLRIDSDSGFSSNKLMDQMCHMHIPPTRTTIAEPARARTMPPQQKQAPLPFGAGAAAAPAADAVPEESRDAKLAHGTLSHGRQRGDQARRGRALNLVHNRDNRTVLPQQTMNKMQHSQKNLVAVHMKPINDVLKKKAHLATVKGQFRSYFVTSAAEPVR